jgi:macrolide transport system ATP-binding/permease protein
VLADEPTGDLDTKSGEEIMGLLKALAGEDGRTVIVVTHNEAFVPMADRVVRLVDGRVESDDRYPSAAAAVGAPGGAAAAGRPPIGSLFRMSVEATLRRLTRGILTALGVAIGVASMVLLIGLGAGLQHSVTHSLLSLGPLTTISVSPQTSGGTGALGGAASTGVTTPITAATLKRFARLPGARAAYAAVTGVGLVATAKSTGITVAVSALPPPRVWSAGGILPTLTHGRLPRASGQIALGTKTAGALLGRTTGSMAAMIGRTVTFSPEELTGSLYGGGGASAARVGVTHLKVVGLVSGVNVSYVAYGQALSWVPTTPGHPTQYPAATVLARSSTQVTPLSKRIGQMGYSVTTVGSLLKSVNGVFAGIETALGAVGSVALIVSGLMIGVVMSMAVLERRREIGVLRAVGARRRDVSRLFLLESAVTGWTGGAAGGAFAFLGAAIADHIVAATDHALSSLVLIPPWLVLLGLGFGTAVAVVAGAFPASHAAALNPVEALRDR